MDRQVGNEKLKLGITGGIGSGKSSVCRVFRILGIPVFDADSEARVIMENDPGVMSGIVSIAGKEIYSGGLLNTARLADLIFNDQVMLQEVNSIVHPVVFGKFHQWAVEQTAPYVIIEAAILFESGATSIVDKIITVIAPLEERIDRVTRRNRLTRQQVLERVQNQTDDSVKISKSDYVIYNSENDMIIPAVLNIHKMLLDSVNNFYVS